MRHVAYWALALLAVSSHAGAQSVPGEIIMPGATYATADDADAARINPGAPATLRRWRARYTHVSEWRSRSRVLEADALTFATPILFGFAGSLGLSWTRPDLQPAAPASRQSGHVVTGEFGLSFSPFRAFGFGTRIRISGAGGDGSFVQRQAGTVSLDLGAIYRPWPALSLALVAMNALGPAFDAALAALIPGGGVGYDRMFGGGVGFRPAGTNALTLGVDAAVTQSGRGFVRGGLRVGIPYVGYVRAEAVWDVPTPELRYGAVRGSVALDVSWGALTLGGGALAGLPVETTRAAEIDTQLGAFGSVRIEPTRDNFAIPVLGQIVSIVQQDDLGARSVGRLVLRLDQLRRDPSVRGVIWIVRGDVGGLANGDEVREAFARLRASGRRVVCQLQDPSGSTYYACAGADEIYMDPVGTLRLAGIRTSRFFLGDALREVGVRTDFVRIGGWKSAPEQFTRRSSSPEALAQENQLLDDLYATLLRGVAMRPGIGPERARERVEGGPYGARQALDAHLVDHLGDRDMVERAVSRELGAQVVSMENYLRVRSARWSPASGVAVLYVNGDIVEDEDLEIPGVGIRLVGARDVVRRIEQLSASPRVGAIVLRVDSPGGSAQGSEFIWRAMTQAARRVPIVVSMGRIAASGGYYIAAPGREIFANPCTLTGSIGIFFGKADVSELLSRLHIGVQLLRRGAHADMDSLFRPFDDEERARVGELITDFYNVFLRRVAAGRGMEPREVHRVAEGRVFAATRARDVRLVDRLGGLLAAIDRARELAHLPDDAEVVEYPQEQGGLLGLLSQLVASSPAAVPTARLLRGTEIGSALSWLFALAWAGHGRAMAMTEWPLGLP